MMGTVGTSWQAEPVPPAAASPPKSPPTSPPTSRGVPPHVLISGSEELLAQRALAATLEALRATDPQVDVVKLSATTYERGALFTHASPSLFGGTTALVLTEADEAAEDCVTDVLDYLGAPAEHVTLIVAHRGGNRGKKLLDALKARKARVLEAPAVKSDRDKSDFVTNEFRAARRKVTPEAVRALVEAVGKDLAELAAACAQLVQDTQVVDESVVETYHAGKIEATGFRVADAAIAGAAGEARTAAPRARRRGRPGADRGCVRKPVAAARQGRRRATRVLGGAG